MNEVPVSILSLLQCPACHGELIARDVLICVACEQSFRLQQRAPHPAIPIFTEPPPGLIPSEKLERSPNVGTPWRKANWHFLEQQLDQLPQDALILDVGAGRGDFADALQGRHFIELDIYPYPEVDIACDLTRMNPFRPASFDTVLLLNVMEHIYDTHQLLETLAQLLKPGGVLLVAIPFMVKIHQAPVDFVRYTHFALGRLGETHGFVVESLDGYYDPIFFLGEGIGNLERAFLSMAANPALTKTRRYMGRLALSGMRGLAVLLGRLIAPAKLMPPAETRSLAPTGYHVVYRKKLYDQ